MGVTIFRPGQRLVIPSQSVQVWSPAASGGFLPSSLPDLWAWWDVSTLSTLYQDSAGSTPVTTNGDPIGYIADRSGNDRYVRQTGATSTRPTYTIGAQNGLPAASFDGGDYLDSVAAVDSIPLTIVGAGRRSSTVGVSMGIVSNFHATNNGARFSFGSANTLFASIATPLTNRNSGATTYAANAPYIGGARFNTTESAVMANGVITMGAHTATAVSNIVSFGRLSVNATSSLYSGYICEVCVYSRALSDTEIGQLATYLNSKWSVY